MHLQADEPLGRQPVAEICPQLAVQPRADMIPAHFHPDLVPILRLVQSLPLLSELLLVTSTKPWEEPAASAFIIDACTPHTARLIRINLNLIAMYAAGREFLSFAVFQSLRDFLVIGIGADLNAGVKAVIALIFVLQNEVTVILLRAQERIRRPYHRPSRDRPLLHRVLRFPSLLRPARQALARNSRGTPRIANRLLRRARDVAQVEGEGQVLPEVVQRTFELLGIDGNGLERSDRRILESLARMGGGPVGLKTIAAAVDEAEDTVEWVVEPWLIRQGFLARSPQGRLLLENGWKAIGQDDPGGARLPLMESTENEES